MEFTLICLQGNRAPFMVTLKTEGLGKANINRLTDRIVVVFLRLLNEAKLENSEGRYLPMRQEPSSSGAKFYVRRDAFFAIQPFFREIVQAFIDETQESQKRQMSHS